MTARRLATAGLATAVLMAVGAALVTARPGWLPSWLTIFYRGETAGTAGLIEAPTAFARVAAGDLLLVDIRTPREWRTTGVPRGAARSDWWQSAGREGFLRDVLAAAGGDRDRPIALICARGGRSSEASRFLRTEGFRAVYDIGEGMLGSRAGPGWLARGLPVAPCATC